VKFFAEQGFGGQTRELAKRMGITHSAIYRHFPSKEALIERVYEEIYLSRWSPSWAGLIQDRTLSLQARLSRFYLEYVEQVFEYNWVRIFVFSGMKSFDITKRYLQIVRDQIIEPACRELRHELKLPRRLKTADARACATRVTSAVAMAATFSCDQRTPVT
jgi:AcrR family transcriptional regulator